MYLLQPTDHEHLFEPHDDPRWLICSCGQYAVRTRNITGERLIRLIDTPKPSILVAAYQEVHLGRELELSNVHEKSE